MRPPRAVAAGHLDANLGPFSHPDYLILCYWTRVSTRSKNSLSSTERASLWVGRLVNEQRIPKHLQQLYLQQISRRAVNLLISRRTYVDRLEHTLALQPPRGVVLAANHRSFFDLWVAFLPLFNRAPWVRRLFCPVRANFFYEHPLGMALNLGVGGGCMYPPVFRDPAKSDLNSDAIARLCDHLAHRGTLVGMHPEGTRNKGDDPYALLPAQPGIGQLLLGATPLVIPVFVNGLTNSASRDAIRTVLQPERRYSDPVVVVYGEPLDYREYLQSRPRLTLYKKLADEVRAAISKLGDRERQLRQRIQQRELDNDPGWLS